MDDVSGVPVKNAGNTDGTGTEAVGWEIIGEESRRTQRGIGVEQWMLTIYIIIWSYINYCLQMLTIRFLIIKIRMFFFFFFQNCEFNISNKEEEKIELKLKK